MDLTLIDTETLYKELCSRNDAVVLILHRFKTASQDDTEFFWNGGKAISLGLLDLCGSAIMDNIPGECND